MFTLAKYPLINVREYWRASQKGQSREIGNIRRQRKKTKQKHNPICVWHHYTQTNKNNVNKTWALLQTNKHK
jgi:hypothetical protein